MNTAERVASLRKGAMFFALDLYKSYGPRRILENIDLAVHAGEFCTIVGPSGCGKSTLFRLILGQERPTSGELRIEGAPGGLPDTRRGIVYQKYSLLPHLTVLDNVILGKRLLLYPWEWLLKRRECREVGMQLLSRVRLTDEAMKYPHQLSGGQQQRVAIAQALITKPKILLMDEPFGALDSGTREDMQAFLLELWEETGTTIFFVTHDLEEAVYLGTRVLVLSQYYTDDRGDDPSVNRGARIVGDYPLEKEAKSTLVKATAAFSDLIRRIREDSFKPAHRVHVDAFNLKHPDSFRTLMPEESHAVKS